MWKCSMFDGSDHENFSLQNYSKFAVECDWNSEISQKSKIWVFWKNDGFFWEKNLNSFKIVKAGKFAVECVSNDIIS